MHIVIALFTKRSTTKKNTYVFKVAMQFKAINILYSLRRTSLPHACDTIKLCQIDCTVAIFGISNPNFIPISRPSIFKIYFPFLCVASKIPRHLLSFTTVKYFNSLPLDIRPPHLFSLSDPPLLSTIYLIFCSLWHSFSFILCCLKFFSFFCARSYSSCIISPISDAFIFLFKAQRTLLN